MATENIKKKEYEKLKADYHRKFKLNFNKDGVSGVKEIPVTQLTEWQGNSKVFPKFKELSKNAQESLQWFRSKTLPKKETKDKGYERLLNSIRMYGQIQPVVIARGIHGAEVKNLILAGHGRVKALKAIAEETDTDLSKVMVSCVTTSNVLDYKEAFEFIFRDNMDRQQIDPERMKVLTDSTVYTESTSKLLKRTLRDMKMWPSGKYPDGSWILDENMISKLQVKQALINLFGENHGKEESDITQIYKDVNDLWYDENQDCTRKEKGKKTGHALERDFDTNQTKLTKLEPKSTQTDEEKSNIKNNKKTVEAMIDKLKSRVEQFVTEEKDQTLIDDQAKLDNWVEDVRLSDEQKKHKIEQTFRRNLIQKMNGALGKVTTYKDNGKFKDDVIDVIEKCEAQLKGDAFLTNKDLLKEIKGVKEDGTFDSRYESRKKKIDAKVELLKGDGYKVKFSAAIKDHTLGGVGSEYSAELIPMSENEIKTFNAEQKKAKDDRQAEIDEALGIPTQTKSATKKAS